jgi:hypothetical protein
MPGYGVARRVHRDTKRRRATPSFKLIIIQQHVHARVSTKSTSQATTPNPKAPKRHGPNPSTTASTKKVATQDIPRTYKTTSQGDGVTTMGAIDVPFDPKALFGAVRSPVGVTIGGYRPGTGSVSTERAPCSSTGKAPRLQDEDHWRRRPAPRSRVEASNSTLFADTGIR